MSEIPHFRSPLLSLWQSAVAEVLRRNGAATEDDVLGHHVMRAATQSAADFHALASGDAVPAPAAVTARAAAPGASEPLARGLDPFAVPGHLMGNLENAVAAHLTGVGDDARACAGLYLRLALTVDPVARARIEQQILDYGTCDPRWSEVIVEYLWNVRLRHQPVPYVPPQGPDDAVLDALPDRVTIGFLADWGTGTDSATALLQDLAARRTPGVPFVLVHLGDIYYSGTRAEVDRFVAVCRGVLGPDVPVFSLAGNHDMYAGGQPYYDAIARLNAPPFTQRTSYFNLRNAHWQFQAMDTGLNDRDPFQVGRDTTFLDPREVAWHNQQLAAAGGRKVVLLSHHQPFSAFAAIAGGDENRALLGAFDGTSPYGDGTNYLPGVALWLWGHEHTTAFYEPYAGVRRGRCIGSGAIPVTVASNPYTVRSPGIRFDANAVLANDGTVYSHGYAVLEIDGPNGTVSYYQRPAGSGPSPMFVEAI